MSLNRDKTIDYLRGISILLVLVHHFHLSYRLDRGWLAQLLPADLIRRVAGNGNYGVTIFFVISGFLITSTTLARFGELYKVRLRAFYTFRFARIIPGVVLALSLVVALGLAGIKIFQNNHGNPSLGLTVLSILTFSHNVLMQKFGWFNYCLNTLWSLSVEEVFYFTFPLLCILFRKQYLILGAWATLVVAAPIYRAQRRSDDIAALCGYISCFDAIAIGCLTAVLTRRARIPVALRRSALGASAAFMAAVYLYQGVMDNIVFGVSLIALSTAIILVARPPKKEYGASAVCWFGRHSYELYLFHIIILALMRTAVSRDALAEYAKPLWFGVFIALSALAAHLVSKFYSEPLNGILRRGINVERAQKRLHQQAATDHRGLLDP